MILNKQNKAYLEFLYSFYRKEPDNNIFLAFEGEVNHKLVKVLADNTLERLERENEEFMTRRNVYHVLIEAMQNISKQVMINNSQEPVRMPQGILMVIKNIDRYQVTTGNLVRTERVEDLKKLLDRINFLKKEELDESYRSQLKNGGLTNSGGAGLGFIDIRRKTGMSLEYNFLPSDSEKALFLLTASIKRQS